tara:strand:+ start:2850 stop:3266 length:417 start_codon:yes stop_codon:yes gene_type:complete
MTPIDPASVAATHRGGLLDRCLTGCSLSGRATRLANEYQWVTPIVLLDRCLTERGFAGADWLAQARPCRIAGIPQATGAWIDRETLDEQDGSIGKVGYEITSNRVFFQCQPPRPLEEIDAELADVEKRILGLLREVTE